MPDGAPGWYDPNKTLFDPNAYRKWLEETWGSYEGAEEAWNAYLEANPDIYVGTYDPSAIYTDVEGEQLAGEMPQAEDYVDKYIVVSPGEYGDLPAGIYIDEDGDGYPDTMVEDFSGMFDILASISGYTFPSVGGWLDEHEGDYEWRDVDEYIDAINQLLDEGLLEEQRAGALEQAARGLGFNTYEDYQSRLAEMQGRLTGEEGYQQMPGLSDEYREAVRRENLSKVRAQEKTAERLISNALASTGSSARALAEANESIRQIQDMRLVQSAEIAQMEDEARREQFNSMKEMYGLMVQQGTMREETYLQLLQQDRALALQAYQAQINTALRQNEQLLSIYNSDMQSLALTLENHYKAIQTEMGLIMAQYDIASNLMEQAFAEYQIDMIDWVNQMEAWENENSNEGLLNALTLIVDIGLGVAGLFTGGATTALIPAVNKLIGAGATPEYTPTWYEGSNWGDFWGGESPGAQWVT